MKRLIFGLALAVMLSGSNCGYMKFGAFAPGGATPQTATAPAPEGQTGRQALGAGGGT